MPPTLTILPPLVNSIHTTLNHPTTLHPPIHPLANPRTGNFENGNLPTPFGPLQCADAAHGKATICWRPEAVTLGGPLKGTVTSTAFQGGHLDVFVSAGEETVRLQLPGKQQVENGQLLQFSVPIDEVVRIGDRTDA